MSERGFGLHPLAARDIREIWEYIVATIRAAARRVREELREAIRALVRFPHEAIGGRTSPPGRCDSLARAIT